MGFTIILDNRVQEVRELLGDDGVTVICGQLLRVCLCRIQFLYISAACIVF